MHEPQTTNRLQWPAGEGGCALGVKQPCTGNLPKRGGREGRYKSERGIYVRQYGMCLVCSATVFILLPGSVSNNKILHKCAEVFSQAK